jgi:hypothetical protein
MECSVGTHAHDNTASVPENVTLELIQFHVKAIGLLESQLASKASQQRINVLWEASQRHATAMEPLQVVIICDLRAQSSNYVFLIIDFGFIDRIKCQWWYPRL